MRFGTPRQKRLSDLFVNMAALVTIIPLAPLINRYLPPIMVGSWNLDLPIAILAAFLLVMGVIKIFRPLIIPAFLLICIVLVYNLFTNAYTFPDVIHDYKNMVLNNWTHKDQKGKRAVPDQFHFSKQAADIGKPAKGEG